MARKPKHAKSADTHNNNFLAHLESKSTVSKCASSVTAPSTFGKHNAGNDDNPKMEQDSKLKKKLWKMLLIVFIVVVALLLAGTATAIALYVNTFESNLQSKNVESLNNVLTDDGFDKVTYTLVLGSDSRTGTSDIDEEEYSNGIGRADVIMLVRTDPQAKTITLLSVPRDTPAEINGATTKINEAFAQGGPTYAIETVEELTGVPISHYVEIDFGGTEKLIDAMGGVTVNVPEKITDEDIVSGEEITIQAGEQKLDGRETLLLARTRKQYAGSQDGQRQSNVRNVTSAIINEVLNKPLYDLPALMLKFSECLSSDLKVSDMVTIAREFNGDVTIYSAGGPTDGDFMEEYGGLWLCYPAPEKWAEIMSVVEAGGDPSSIE